MLNRGSLRVVKLSAACEDTLSSLGSITSQRDRTRESSLSLPTKGHSAEDECTEAL